MNLSRKHIISSFKAADKKKLIGIITKGDIIKAYNRQRLTRKKMSLDEK